MRRLHSTAMSDDDPSRRQHARQQWFDEAQITLEQLAEQPTVWRGVNEPPATAWQVILGLLGTGNPLIWFVFGILVFGWATGLIKFPNPWSG